MNLEPSLEARQEEQRLKELERMQRGIASDAEMASNPETLALSPGDSVFSADGVALGTVRSVKGGYFDLDREGEAQFWLSSAYISSARDGRVDLTLSEEVVAEHRLQKPGLETVDRNLAGTGDRVRTSLEALQMRERIEQELLEQRGRLDSGLRGPQ